MSLVLQTEVLFDIHQEMEVLIEQHYQELTLNKDKVKLKPVWTQYKELEDKGEFYLLTARIDGELVGYSAFFLKPHIHYNDVIVATNDVLFLIKRVRTGTTGIKLIKYSEQRMKELGATKMTWHIKHANDIRPILHRMGYVDEDIIVGKML